ncbi:hypothetical protein GW17_00061521 [Ensete ventricosum]|nr:hypothetical protein GW17_00061521 [Ensete ventricosum]RZS24647.1 hypothetical protein BHM03_00057740 [Ensete ventricosum]
MGRWLAVATGMAGVGREGRRGWQMREEKKKMRAATVWLRTSGSVPFLLEMPTIRRQETVATGKSGKR